MKSHPWRLWPRGRLDISWCDLLYAAQVGCFGGALPRRIWPTAQPHLAMLSVRTAWDALLAVKQWPVGSEIIFSEANISGMVSIMRAHGLVHVAAPLCPRTLTLDASEVEALVTPRTRAILVSPLFGSRMELEELAALARKYDLLLVEDNAQAYRDGSCCGSPEADVSLFSFGLIKTRTALGGAVVFARDPQLLEALRKQAESYPRVSTLNFYRKLGRASLLYALGHPLLFGLFWRFLERKGLDPDVWLSQATRGMNGQNLLWAIRHRPHRATLKLLHRRLRQERTGQLQLRMARGQQAMRVLPNALGQEAVDCVFWALPVQVSNREDLVLQARHAGFDLSRSSSLLSHSTEATPFSHALESTVFLPIGTPMPEREWQRLLQLVARPCFKEVGIL